MQQDPECSKQGADSTADVADHDGGWRVLEQKSGDGEGLRTASIAAAGA